MSIVIELEGIDGSGKTTALNYIADSLTRLGYSVLKTQEVGAPLIPACQKLREIALSAELKMSKEAMQFVFAAMRIQNQIFYESVDHQYDFIISDRGWLSHLAYCESSVGEAFANSLYNDLLKKITSLPDVIIYFDADPATALLRRSKRGVAPDAVEIRGNDFIKKVYESYKKHIAQISEQVEIISIDANKDVFDVQKQLDKVINSFIQGTATSLDILSALNGEACCAPVHKKLAQDEDENVREAMISNPSYRKKDK